MTQYLVFNCFLLLSSFLFTFLFKSNISNDNNPAVERSVKDMLQDNLIDSGPVVGAVTEKSAVFLVKPFKPSKIKFQISEDSAFSNSFFSEEITSDQNNFNFTKIPAVVERAPAWPRRSSKTPRQQQDDLAGLAAAVARQAQFSAHARTHRASQSLAGARPAARHRAAGSPESVAQDRPRGRPDDARRPGQVRAATALRHPGGAGHRRHGHRH